MSERVSRACGIVFLLLELAVVPQALSLMLRAHLSNLSPLLMVVLAMTFGSIALCILMSFSSLSENRFYPLHTFLFELAVFLCCVAPVTDLVTRALDTAGKPGWNMFVNTLFYLLGVQIAYVILIYEFLLMTPEKRKDLMPLLVIGTALTAADVLLTFLNVPFGFFFTVNASGAYESAPTYWLAYLIPAGIIVLTALAAVRGLPPGRTRRALLLFWVCAAVPSILQTFFEELTVQYTGYTLSLVVIYLNIQSELDTLCPGSHRK